ncbi:LOW QUALITY PROTEIN: cyclic AMP-dependent transcription factor ATF-4 [Eleginops maclovinus]|uniref:LOW QUALITY PROTEIN: cyclic AMP-dependent transcription factor ATF-4 n=1 Tax=Eleginops maclovinus TaxID=56733 RepID=UPI00308089AA
MMFCLALEDVEALYFGPSFLTADPMGPLLDEDEDEEEALSPSSFLEGKAPASPPLSFFASSSSPLSSASPPPSPHPTHPSLFLETKPSGDTLSFPWLGASELLHAPAGADKGTDDAFAGMDWMSEKIDLSELDLESLIGSCSEDSPSSPEELLASLDPQMDLDLDAFDTSLPILPALPLELPLSEEVKEEVVLKSEPPSPAYTLELGSEVDVLDVLSAPSITSTLLPSPPPSTQIVVVHALLTLPEQPIKSSPPSSDCESDSGIDSPPSPPVSPLSSSSRTKPYSKPEPASPSSVKPPRVKSVSGVPKVEKKLKKMEQNKTAATRYRQKKRVEQDLLNDECEELLRKNGELEERAGAISREIQYLKDLMEEVRKRRSKSKAQ